MTEAIIILLKEHTIIAPLLFILLRVSSIVIPPIPGVVVDFIGVVAFGRLFGLLYGGIGVMLGAVITFFIARKFRKKVLKRFTSLQKLHDWEEKLSEQKKFWGLVLLRLPTAVFFDYINYAAGLTTISFKRFFFATLISSAPLMFIFYFFGEFSIQKGLYPTIIFLAIITFLLIIFNKKRALQAYRAIRSKQKQV